MSSATFRSFLGRAAVVFCALALLAPAALADKTARWKFTKGQKIEYVVNQKTTSTSEVAGQKFTSDQDQIIDIIWDIKDVDADGNASMVQTITRWRMKMGGSQPGLEGDYDSKSDKEPVGLMAGIAPIFKAFVGSPIELTMSPRGQISKVVIPAKITDATKAMGPMGSMFGEEGLKNMTSQATVILPEKPIPAGQVWTDTKKMDLPFGAMSIAATYKFDSEDTKSGLDTIGVTTKIEIQPKDGAAFGEIKITEQEGQGKAIFDTAQGNIKSSSMNQKMTMLMTINGMEIVAKSESTATMERVKPVTNP